MLEASQKSDKHLSAWRALGRHFDRRIVVHRTFPVASLTLVIIEQEGFAYI